MNEAPYAELFCQSHFSFLAAASRPNELVERAQALGYKALAITDECSVSGVVAAYEAWRGLPAEGRLKLIVGSVFSVDAVHPSPMAGLRFIALAQTRRGYATLCHTITAARRRAEKGSYRLLPEDMALLRECNVIWLPDLAQTMSWPAQSAWLQNNFPSHLFIGLTQHREAQDADRCAALDALSQSLGLPLTAVGGALMHARSRKPLLDVLMATAAGVTVAQMGQALYPNSERVLRSRERLAHLFAPELMAQSVSIADTCTFCLSELSYEYPDEIMPQGVTASGYLRDLTEAGLITRYPQGTPESVRKTVEHELTLISEMRYEAYFLTVYDIVRFARSRGILCQGRGSAANSAVCYALAITEVDPSRMQLLFERFISKERNEPPDIDVDFEHERREEVIQYLYQKYGRHRAALTANLITYRPRSAIRDVGKALGFSLDQVDRLAKNVSWWDGRHIPPERLIEVGFDPHNPQVERLLSLAQELQGFPRHLSQHPGGFVIARGPLADLVPIENASMAERTVIQWDKYDLDVLGLLKVDVLALGMLSAIRGCIELINRYEGMQTRCSSAARQPGFPPPGEVCSKGSPADEQPGYGFEVLARNDAGIASQPTIASPPTPGLTFGTIPAEDPAVYEMCGRGDTMGVFQIESRAQMVMLPRLKPQNFYDLVIEVAIVRPGPIQGKMVHPYLRRRQGLEPVTYPSHEVEHVLKRTLGVSIFQEQVMQLAVAAAGFTPGEADQLRRAMAAWKRKGGIGPFRDKLINGMLARGYGQDYAEQIYQQIQGFGEYGFPESHAASFALLVYVSAWLKCHHQAAFTAALLNAQPLGFYSNSQLTQDARRKGVEILPVDVAVSEWGCGLEGSSAEQAGPVGTKAMPTLRKPPPPLGEGWPTQGSYPSHTPQPVESTPPLPRGEGRGEGRCVTSNTQDPRPVGKMPTLQRRIYQQQPQAQHYLPRPPGKGLGEGSPTQRPHHSPSTTPAIRLGFKQVVGLSEAAAERIFAARAQAPFISAEDLAHRATLTDHDMKCLASANALQSLEGHRRSALWAAIGVDAPLSMNCNAKPVGWDAIPAAPATNRKAGITSQPTAPNVDPNIASNTDPALRRSPAARQPGSPLSREALFTPPTEAENMLADYAHLGLTLGRHPLALLRERDPERFKRERLINSEALRHARNGQLVRTVGIVTCRQRPETAAGVTFVTLEDEAGYSNIIVWRDLGARQRNVLIHSSLMAVYGTLQNDGVSVHLIAGHLRDCSDWLEGLRVPTREFH